MCACLVEIVSLDIGKYSSRPSYLGPYLAHNIPKTRGGARLLPPGSRSENPRKVMFWRPDRQQHPVPVSGDPRSMLECSDFFKIFRIFGLEKVTFVSGLGRGFVRLA